MFWTTAGSQRRDLRFWIRTCWSLPRWERSCFLACISNCFFWTLWRFSGSSWIPSLSVSVLLMWETIVDLRRLPKSISAGLGIFRLTGVIRKYSSASCMSFPEVWAIMITFYTVWICLSTKPLPCGRFGEVVVWTNPQDSAKDRNSELEYCGPLSLTTFSGVPNSENIYLISLIIWVDVQAKLRRRSWRSFRHNWYLTPEEIASANKVESGHRSGGKCTSHQNLSENVSRVPR